MMSSDVPRIVHVQISGRGNTNSLGVGVAPTTDSYAKMCMQKARAKRTWEKFTMGAMGKAA